MNQMVLQNKHLNLQAVALGNACTGTPGQSKQAPGQCNLGGSFDTQYAAACLVSCPLLLRCISAFLSSSPPPTVPSC